MKSSWVSRTGVPFIAYRGSGARGGVEEIARRGIPMAAVIASLLDLPAALAGGPC